MRMHVVLKDKLQSNPLPDEYIIGLSAMRRGWKVSFSTKPDYVKPDVLLFNHSWKTPTPACRPVKVQWFFDLVWRYCTQPLDSQHLWNWPTMKSMDLVLLRERGLFPIYKRRGINVRYLDQACWAPMFRVPLAHYNPIADVAFTGSCYEEGGRLSLLQHMASRFNVHVWSKDKRWKDFKKITWHPEGLYDGRMRTLGSKAKLSVAINYRNDIDGYWSNRMWLLMASGVCMLVHYVPGLEDVVEDGKHCVFFDSHGQCLSLARKYLDDDSARARIADAGRVLALSKHSYENRLEELESMMLPLLVSRGHKPDCLANMESSMLLEAFFGNLRRVKDML